MSINPAIFREYDIRGEVGKDLTCEISQEIGKAYGTYISRLNGHTVSIARDNRKSSLKFFKTFSDGVISTGINVVDLGVVSAPMLYYFVIKNNYDGGAIITGSHNAPSINGIKLSRKNALHIAGEELKQLYEIINAKNYLRGVGKISSLSIADNYIEEILKRVKPQRRVKVAVDFFSGTAEITGRRLFKELHCDERVVVDTADKTVDPSRPDVAKRIINYIKNNDVEVGFIFDIDGDRLGIVDEKGKFVPVEKAAALIVKDIARKSQKSVKVICDVKTLSTFFDVVSDLGGEVEMVPTGRSTFRQKLYDDPEIDLGVEASGHIHINYDYFGIDDGLYAASLILQILSTSQKPLSELIAKMPSTFYTPPIEPLCPDEKKFEVVKNVSLEFKRNYDTIDIDGVRVNFGKNQWALIRASNTGPELSLRFEGPSKEEVFKMIDVMARELRKYPEVSTDWVENAKQSIDQ